jgi:penicillin-binding protein 1C
MPNLNKITRIAIFLLFGFTVFFFSHRPFPFDDVYSTVIYDRNNHLLNAVIAADEQWRFPLTTGVPGKFVTCITEFEDGRFFYHPGIDPPAIVRSLWLNFRHQKIVSGASTLTMQVIRLSRPEMKRTVLEKAKELVLALRLELHYTKNEILALYASHAPFGGNVAGLTAAAWRYFGREPEYLSWAETALLAVLPNSPALIHPGRNRQLLLEKRNTLLTKLFRKKRIDQVTLKLSLAESLPRAPLPMPQNAPHLMTHILKSFDSNRTFATTINSDLQLMVQNVIERHNRHLSANKIYNACALVSDITTGEILAYVGNVSLKHGMEVSPHVDIISSPRSTGSILKPMLYAALMQSGEMLPHQLVPDIPVRIGGFAPENFNRTYAGAVPARQALARSLNVPAVHMLRHYSVDRFYTFLKKAGMSTLHRNAREYGLSLILGGAEGTLWDITSMYSHIAQRLIDLPSPHPLHFLKNQETTVSKPWLLDAGACWLTVEAMSEVTRPGAEASWENFFSSQKVAWKTGTSFGFRDAWAVGISSRYAVGVWAGNANGEGRPNLTGIKAAAPILFDIFNQLEQAPWFPFPEYNLVPVEICAHSGYRAGIDCEKTETDFISEAALYNPPCPYCCVVSCDRTKKWRVSSQCEAIADIYPVKWFVLPPVMEWFYKQTDANYRPLPPYRPDCLDCDMEGESALTIIYPGKNSTIYIPLELDGNRGQSVFEVAHREDRKTIYWHLDDIYLGSTSDLHQMAVTPPPGPHTLTVVDEDGARAQRRFTVLAKE